MNYKFAGMESRNVVKLCFEIHYDRYWDCSEDRCNELCANLHGPKSSHSGECIGKYECQCVILCK